MSKTKEKPKFTIRVKDFKNIPFDAFKIFKNGRNEIETEDYAGSNSWIVAGVAIIIFILSGVIGFCSAYTYGLDLIIKIIV